MVKFAQSALVAWGTQVQVLAADLCTAHQVMLWWQTMYKNRGRWVQLLAQG